MRGCTMHKREMDPRMRPGGFYDGPSSLSNVMSLDMAKPCGNVNPPPSRFRSPSIPPFSPFIKPKNRGALNSIRAIHDSPHMQGRQTWSHITPNMEHQL